MGFSCFNFGKNKMDKRTFTNRIGIFAFFLILIMIGFVALHRRGLRNETTSILRTAAEKFALEEKDYILKWAKGEVKDSWGRTLLIESNTGEIQLRSKGPDGITNTPDDILSDRYYRQTPAIITVMPKDEPVDEPKPLEELTPRQRATRVWNKFWNKP